MTTGQPAEPTEQSPEKNMAELITLLQNSHWLGGIDLPDVHEKLAQCSEFAHILETQMENLYTELNKFKHEKDEALAKVYDAYVLLAAVPVIAKLSQTCAKLYTVIGDLSFYISCAHLAQMAANKDRETWQNETLVSADVVNQHYQQIKPTREMYNSPMDMGPPIDMGSQNSDEEPIEGKSGEIRESIKAWLKRCLQDHKSDIDVLKDHEGFQAAISYTDIPIEAKLLALDIFAMRLTKIAEFTADMYRDLNTNTQTLYRKANPEQDGPGR